MIRVIIVEDDFMVAGINREMTEKVNGFSVVKTCTTGAEALRFIRNESVDLAILDVYLPDMLGLELLKEVRRLEIPLDFILITAAHDTKTIEESFRYGVVDYLIKPLDMNRYRKTLLHYLDSRKALEGAVKFNQEELDMVREGKSTDTSPRFRLPKGISKPTLMKIKAAALNSLKNPFTIDDAAEFLSLSRITAHRYLEYLQKTDFLCKDLRYKKVGRPTVLYRINR